MSMYGHGETRDVIDRLMAARALGQPRKHRRHSDTSVDRAVLMQRLAVTLTFVYAMLAVFAIGFALVGMTAHSAGYELASLGLLVFDAWIYTNIRYCERCSTIHYVGRHAVDRPVEAVRPRIQPRRMPVPAGWAPGALGGVQAAWD